MLLSGGGVPVSGWYFNDKEILYSTSWDWLMPVWYKFRDLKVDIKDGLLAYNFHCANVAKEILDGGPSPSEACKRLADGIRWYNSINQTVKK